MIKYVKRSIKKFIHIYNIYESMLDLSDYYIELRQSDESSRTNEFDEIYEMYKDKGMTKVVGVESRGFIMGSLLASRLNAGFVLARKPGKLPAETIQESFAKEYGTDTIEIHKDAITEDDVVLIHDDLLATGGTVKAAYNLVQKFNPKKIHINFIIELTNLNGRKPFGDNVEITSLLELEEKE